MRSWRDKLLFIESSYILFVSPFCVFLQREVFWKSRSNSLTSRQHGGLLSELFTFLCTWVFGWSLLIKKKNRHWMSELRHLSFNLLDCCVIHEVWTSKPPELSGKRGTSTIVRIFFQTADGDEKKNGRLPNTETITRYVGCRIRQRCHIWQRMVAEFGNVARFSLLPNWCWWAHHWLIERSLLFT